MKYYFPKDSDPEMCYQRSHFVEVMQENGISEIEVYPARMVKKDDIYAWCREYGDVIETGPGGGCGKSCEFYKPRNGKNGRCRFSVNLYEPLEETITLKLTRHERNMLQGGPVQEDPGR